MIDIMISENRIAQGTLITGKRRFVGQAADSVRHLPQLPLFVEGHAQRSST